MKELFQHIERLLTGNDCVVVPGLGGFVLHEVHFSIDEAGSILRPGGKEISFNVRLTFNDGILVQSYQEKHQLSFDAAVETIREEVASIHAALNEGHILSVGRLGTLRKNEDGQILFRPDNRNLFCPECYGLTSYVYHTLEQRASAAEKPRKVRKPARAGKKSRKRKEETRILTPPRRNIFGQVLTGIAACFLLLLIAKPAGELKQFKTQEAFLLREYFMSGLPETRIDTFTQAGITPLPNESTQPTSTRRRQRSNVETESMYDDIDSLFGTPTSGSTPRKGNKILPSTDDIDSLFGLISFIASGAGNNDSSKQLAARTKKADTTKQKADQARKKRLFGAKKPKDTFIERPGTQKRKNSPKLPAQTKESNRTSGWKRLQPHHQQPSQQNRGHPLAFRTQRQPVQECHHH